MSLSVGVITTHLWNLTALFSLSLRHLGQGDEWGIAKVGQLAGLGVVERKVPQSGEGMYRATKTKPLLLLGFEFTAARAVELNPSFILVISLDRDLLVAKSRVLKLEP